MPVASLERASSQLADWVRTRLSGTADEEKVPKYTRDGMQPVFFAQATRTASYKNNNDDAVFCERLPDGLVIAALFDGVTIPKRNNRAGHTVAAFVRERLRATLVEQDGRRPIVETVLAGVLQESITVLEGLQGAATTATVTVVVPMPTGNWRVYVLNAGNSRASALLPDGTLQPLTRIKPPGTPFAAVNTLSHGYTYRLEPSKSTVPAGTTILLTSDGIHDHIADTDIWAALGRAIASATAAADARALEQLTRSFVDGIVELAAAAQTKTHLSDDATALAILLGQPSAALEQKFIPPSD